ncbi:hypothetical protein O6V14_17410 [Sphingomonas faeni]|uniref:hypothetical protein n=1 Tax=Sphingomonas faeni TaxID=185950 RepID=UPI00335E9AB6
MAAALQLRLWDNSALVRTSFTSWHAILDMGADQIGSARQIAGTDVRFRRITRHREKLHLDFWIGSSDAAAVQLNQPSKAGSVNPGTSIAVDAKGRRYVVRQGDLHGNPPSTRIKGPDFTQRTGLEPVDMVTHGKAAGRARAPKQWFVVAQLDGVSDVVIRNDTAEFVRRCWNARTYGAKAAEDQQRLQTLFGNAERGGWYDVDPALQPRRVLKVQGYVSESLEQVLGGFDIALEKPRHAANYEVDGTVDAPKGPILIEIKTGISPADVYCGVGQLTVYPILLADLAAHSKILLLPGIPGPALVTALEGCGVELHSYELKRGRRRATALFTAAFLHRCGVPKGGVRDLVAKGLALP